MIFKCKNCGGNSVYHPEKKRMWCPHCESEDSEELIESGSMENCSNCGAPLEGVNEHTSALKCGHCGSYLILKERVEGEKRADLILPFAITKEQAVAKLKEEFGRRIFTPDTFLSHASLQLMEGSYVPFWLYNYLSRVDYEGRATRVSVSRRGNTEITETSHYHVVRKMEIPFQRIPVDASTRMADDVMDLMEPYEYEALLNFEEKYMSGFEGEVYNFSSQGGEERARQKASRDSEQFLSSTIGGYTTNTTIHKNINLEKEKSSFALLPVWVYKYDFQGKEYLYHVNGQTGKVIGKTPTDNKKGLLYSATVGGLILIACQCINWITGVF
ncbi:MAG: hypothetical protein IKW28_02450 [Lachnospiraceae bacterium]|nr:hypothetical protein [Lachnospiraceae bacterium]